MNSDGTIIPDMFNDNRIIRGRMDLENLQQANKLEVTEWRA